MESTTTPSPGSNRTLFSHKSLIFLAILGTLALAGPLYFSASPGTLWDHRLKMEKSSGKNGKHANPKAREQAEREYRKAREEFQQLDQKPNKTPKEKDLLKKLRAQVKRLQKKKDFSGENHSQKHKGN